MPDTLEHAVRELLGYCESNDWAGHDPYDALNSRLLTALPFLDSRIPRLILTQLLKRSPVNVRGLLLIPKKQNPKALGLFLSSLLKISAAGMDDSGGRIESLILRLTELRSEGTPYSCWGYSFPWQTRTIVVPAGAPNLVCTTFVAGALLDAYEQRRDERCLRMAASAAEYIARELYWEAGDAAGFSYPQPSVRARVHNANFLAAELLCRAYTHTGNDVFVGPALRAARYSAAMQRKDGSWLYGEAPTQNWIDNFHTGYNLCALKSIGRVLGTQEFESCVERGMAFYQTHFFREDGSVKYFHDRNYPIDIHCVAQSILTLLEFRDRDLGNVAAARSVLDWAMQNMWDKRGYFYYRVLRAGTIRTSYMRWSQAWMLLAMSALLCALQTPMGGPATMHSAARS